MAEAIRTAASPPRAGRPAGDAVLTVEHLAKSYRLTTGPPGTRSATSASRYGAESSSASSARAAWQDDPGEVPGGPASSPPAASCSFDGEPSTAPPPEMAPGLPGLRPVAVPVADGGAQRHPAAAPPRLSRPARRSAAGEALAAVGLPGAADRYPWQLSGGMQQRVAIARALAYQPELLLMDEPFASVDAQTRVDLEDLVLRVGERARLTIAVRHPRHRRGRLPRRPHRGAGRLSVQRP